jgi:hypothetical protein
MTDHIADPSYNSDQNISQNIYDNELNKNILTKSENVSTDLTIKTSEGDIVKLSTQSFYDFKSLLYDQRGRVYSDAGTITNQISYREMTLESGESFTFSVEGNLNEQELDDIKKIVGQIDSIVHHMKNNNMDKALEKALTMGNFDTVSSFTADLNVKRSYSMISETVQNKIAQTEDNLRKNLKKPIRQLVDHHFKNLLKEHEKIADPFSAFLEQLRQH